MSLRIDIEKLYNDNTGYLNPSQATNQASSLSALSQDLYTDSKRFIYELLQNADDSVLPNESVNVCIKLFNEYLVVAHTGKPFDSDDIRGICSINNGTKKEDLNKTGYKGLGFKSVFGQSENVTIFSDNEYFRFDSSYEFGWKDSWEITQAFWEQENKRKFMYPWQIIPIYTKAAYIHNDIKDFITAGNWKVATIIRLSNKDETQRAVRELSQNLNMFLFLKNISEINFAINTAKRIEINRSVVNQILIKKNDSIKTRWITNAINLQVPQELKIELQNDPNIPDKLKLANSIELTLAAKIGDNGITKLISDEKLLYSYLPTDETKYLLPVLVNTSFLTNANREHLHTDSKWNQWIFKNIAIEIFKWIALLVQTEVQFQAYRLIPDDTFADELGKQFNQGIKEAIGTIPFLLSKQNQLVKIEDSIVDFTFLSNKEFIGEESIKKFIDDFDRTGVTSTKKFIQNTGFSPTFKKLGAKCFEWSVLSNFLYSISFLSTHSIPKNIALIKHFKNLSENEKVKDITIEKLNELPFIWDHKDYINIPSQICFPTADDSNWDNPENELSFLHLDLQKWLSTDSEMRLWLERLGVTEKTDVTYITHTIIPKVDSYITVKNAIQTIRDLFIHYTKGDLDKVLLSQLSRLKLLTKQGTLLTAKDCFLSNVYSPRLEIEDVLDTDFFVSEEYLTNISEKDEWKRFFKMLGVNDSITLVPTHSKGHKGEFIIAGWENQYFEEKDKKFSPYYSTFTASSYKDAIYLKLLEYTNDYSFSSKFWKDVITNISPIELSQPAIAYWGHSGMPGQINGNEVQNYIPWYIRNIECIPVLTKQCKSASTVLINTKETKSISSNYLPVFDGIELSPDWCSFFDFRTRLQLSDYLELLSKISSDTTEKEKIKKDNISRIQTIYKTLLEQCPNWNELEIQQVSEWANSEMLLNTKQKFSECTSLHYFLDGNNSIFQDQFNFIAINAENKRHPNFEILLGYFQVSVLKQNDFELLHTGQEECIGLKKRLQSIIPYLKIWVMSESDDDKISGNLEQLYTKINSLEIFEAEMLQIKYDDIGFTKRVNVHFDKNILFLTKPWGSNKVLLQLSDTLCNYFHLIGHDKKLDFLLRSTGDEIKEHFEEETYNVPSDLPLVDDVSGTTLQSKRSINPILKNL